MHLAETIAQTLINVPPFVVTMLVSASPIMELRAGLPLAITIYKMNPIEALFWAVLGNAIITIILILFLEKTSSFLMLRSERFNRFFNWLFARTRKRAKDKIKKYGSWGLLFLVALPLPMTGGWTGALVAFLFDIPHRKAIPIIILGLFIAGVIMLTLTSTAIKITY